MLGVARARVVSASPSTTPLATRLCNGAARRSRSASSRAAQIKELSGLAASRTTAGVFWAHNDSGDVRAHLRDRPFGGAARDRRRQRARRPSTGKTSRSTARRSTSATSATTTRSGRRSSCTASPSRRSTAKSVNATTFTLHYPDGPHNAEALMVDPLERQLVIVTKELTGDVEGVRHLARPAGRAAPRSRHSRSARAGWSRRVTSPRTARWSRCAPTARCSSGSARAARPRDDVRAHPVLGAAPRPRCRARRSR